MIVQQDLDIKFKEAFNKVSKIRFKIAPDVRLQLYAFYKQATSGDNFAFNSESNIISGFKFNAWMQLKGMPPKEAKEAYIELVEKIITKKLVP